MWGPQKCGGPGHVPAMPAPKSGPDLNGHKKESERVKNSRLGSIYDVQQERIKIVTNVRNDQYVNFPFPL